MTTIKNLEALKQPLNFEPLFPYCKTISDVDGYLWLKNDKCLLIEIKKDTFAHSKEKIINSVQFDLFRKMAGKRLNFYLIYATHNKPINLDTVIEASECKVQYMECADKEIDISKYNNLMDVVEYLANKKDSDNDNNNSKYHVIVKYPNYELKHAIRNPVGPKWTLNYYAPISCDFDTKYAAIKYISVRFKAKDYNRLNSYILMKKEKSGEDLFVKEYKFKSSN